MSGTAIGVLFALGLAPLPTMAQSLPTGGTVSHGDATITTSGPNLTVTQTSKNAIVSWGSFSIGGSATAHFDNGAGATLNRVSGNLPSLIDGSLTATGSLYLVNPAGVAVGSGGMVRTGGSFVTSTHDIEDADFLDGGEMTFKGDSKAAVVNRGAIVSLDGDVVLTARRVENSGAIEAADGTVGLLGGYEVLLRDTSLADGKFAVKLGGDDTEVINTGTVRAAEIEMRANGGRVEALAGNTNAIVKATGVKKAGGRIFLTAGDGGTVKATQKMETWRATTQAQRAQVAVLPDRGPLPQARPDFSGGEVHVAGGHVTLGGSINVSGAGGDGGAIVAVASDTLNMAATVRLDASGANGGLVLLGGDYQGGADEATRYWSDAIGTTATTLVAEGATIAADGASGAGGNIVVWGDERAAFAGAISAKGTTKGGDAEVSGKATLAYSGTADLTSAFGQLGTLLLDPYDLTISNDASSGMDGFAAGAEDSILNATTLIDALATANVIVSTGTGGGQAGDITVAAPLSWTSDATLTLYAANAITINNDVTARTGGLTLNAGGALSATGVIEIARFTLADGDWAQNTAILPGFEAGDFRIEGGSFLRASSGDGTTANPWLITDIYGVQGMGTLTDKGFALAGDIDAAGTQYWWGGAGFTPVGNPHNNFTGSLDGKDHVISGLTINRPAQSFVGLFGVATTGATIRNIGLGGISVTGGSNSGGLAGVLADADSIVSQAWVNGTVTGGNVVGGLVGRQSNGSSISQSWASGTATGRDRVGGLVGIQTTSSSIDQAWASGAVTGSNNVGGLVGFQGGGTVTASYWDTETTGQLTSDGGAGAVGLTTAQARNATSYSGWDFVTDWYQDHDMRPIGRWMAAPEVAGVAQVSNIYQLQLMDADLDGNYLLTRGIDASATLSTEDSPGIWGAGGFVPVGRVSDANSFSGVFDGQGHMISGLTVNRSVAHFAGLFGRTYNAEIRNVGLDGGFVRGISRVGGLIGHQDGGTVTQSWANGEVTGTDYVGGLVGLNVGNITQSWASSEVTSTSVSGESGGLVGRQSDGSIDQSWASGAVSNQHGVSTWGTGGLVGRQTGGSITQSWASGEVSGSDQVGGLVGVQEDGTVSSSYWDIGTTGQATSAGGPGAIGLTTTEARNAASYGWNFVTDWYQVGDMRPIGRWMAADADANGDIPVSNLTQLQLMDADLDADYVLTRNINAAATASTADSSGIWGDGGFVPIGSFTGTLDGQGHVISTLTINRPSLFSVGLFGTTANATIARIGLDGGSVSGSRFVGGLVGTQFHSTIDQAWTSGTVSGGSHVGGLVGRQVGGIITESWASGAVSGGDSLGGLVGLQTGGTITQAWASVNVSGGNYVGGLVGSQLDSSIDQVWASGEVKGSDSVGGLVGSLNNGTINQAWASGAVTGTSAVGGFVGFRSGGSVTASFWDRTTTLQTNGVGSGIGGGTGLTTAQFQDTAGFMALAGAQGWDFRSVWSPPSDGYYPTLYATSNVVAVDASSNSRVYGDGNDSLVINYYGLQPGDFLRTRAMLSVLPDADVGDYPVTAAGAATTTDPEAYRFVYIPGTLSVTPRPITASANDLSRIYGEANPTLTFDATIGGDGLASFHADLAAAGFDLETAADEQSIIGDYSITLTGTNANYDLTFTPGTLTVDQRPITVTGSLFDRVYGDANPTTTTAFTAPTGGSGSGNGLVNGDTIGSVSVASATADDTSVVGSYAFTPGSAIFSTGSATNYAVTYADGTLNIIPALLTVMANPGQGKVYGETDPALTYAASGFKLSDSAASVLTGDLTRTPGENVGGYAIGQGSLTADNYTIAYAGDTFAITQRPITVSAVDLSRVYGEANPALTFTVGDMGLVNGDTLTGALATAADQQSDAGTYDITQGDLAASANYAMTFSDGTLTVTQRPITVTALGGMSIYGDGGVDPGLSATNLANGESFSVLTGLSNSFGILPTSDASDYTLSVDGILTNGNYTVTTRHDGSWTVTPRAITVSAVDLSRIYGEANPALTYTVGGMGLVNGDALTGALATAADEQSDAGSYDITQGDLAASHNYAMKFSDGTLSVMPRAITVAADDLSRIYGNPNPPLTFIVGGMGLVNGDALTGSLATTADESSDVGRYDIALGTLAASANYAMTFTPGTLSVTQRPIMVSADNLTRLLGQPDPELTWRLTGGSLASFDTAARVFSGALTRSPGETVGSYAIDQGTLAVNANYALGFLGGVLIINPTAMMQDQALERSTAGQFFMASSENGGGASTECVQGVLGPDCAPFVNPANRNLGPHIVWQEP